MKKFLHYIFFLGVLLSFSVFAADEGSGGSCPLDEHPSPPIESYKKNIETLLKATQELVASSTCVKSDKLPDRLDKVIPILERYNLMSSVQSAGQGIVTLVSDKRYYMTNSSMVLPAVQNHQNDILSIQKSISAAAKYVGERCSPAGLKFSENIELDNSIYLTYNRTPEEVLRDMYFQTSHVLVLFRNLVTNVADEKYIDETYFSIAPKGFAEEMRKVYNSESLQKCHDEDPKNKAINEVIKKSFTAGWKYPEAIKIWKDAFQLLLYRGSQLAGSDTVDPAKEAEIQALVSAQKGGLGNSRFGIDSQFFKEFGKKGNSQTPQESAIDTFKRNAYESFMRYLSPYPLKTALVQETRIMVAKLSLVPNFLFSALAQTPAPVTTANQAVTDTLTDGDFRELEKGLYNDYSLLKGKVGLSKENDPKTVTGLVQTLDELEKIRPMIEANAKKACDNLNKQGTNITDAARCNDLVGH